LAVVTVFEGALQTNYLLAVGAVWACVILYTVGMLVDDKVKVQNDFVVLSLICLPLVLVNWGWWAATVFVGVLLQAVSRAIRGLVH
jgi:hypothetical protein